MSHTLQPVELNYYRLHLLGWTSFQRPALDSRMSAKSISNSSNKSASGWRLYSLHVTQAAKTFRANWNEKTFSEIWCHHSRVLRRGEFIFRDVCLKRLTTADLRMHGKNGCGLSWKFLGTCFSIQWIRTIISSRRETFHLFSCLAATWRRKVPEKCLEFN